MSWVLAIDFGTSNTAAAIRQDGRIAVLRLEGSGPMPSAVALMDGEFRLGSHAINARRAVPDAFEEAPKLLLGAGATILAGQEYTARQLVGAVLAQVRSTAITRAGGTEPDLTILTHPIAWDRTQREEFLGAAADAGFDDKTVRLVPEPIAAAYGLLASGVSLGDRIAIVDWGGGTCDVAIVERQAGGADAPFIVSNWAGDSHLGGNDLDNRLFASVFAHLDEDGHSAMIERLGSTDGLGARLTLAEGVRRAKEDLSSHQTTQVLATAAGDEATVTVTRDEYEQAISGEVDRVIETLISALGAQQPSGLDAVVLTGGSASTPVLADAITQRTGVRTIRSGDPKLIVAEGALSVPGVTEPAAVTEPSPAPTPSAPAMRESSPAPPASVPRPRKRSRRWLWAALAAVAAVGVVAAAVIVFVLDEDSDEPRPTKSTQKTEKPSVTCWDGSQESTESDCPVFAGDDALEWALPEWTDDLRCTRARGSSRAQRQCEHGDYPQTAVFAFESNTPEGRADMERFITWGQDPAFNVFTDKDVGWGYIDGVSEIYFAEESTADGSVKGVYSAIEYDGIPVLVWFQTVTTDTLSEQQVQQHLEFVYLTAHELRGADEIDEVVDYIP